VVFYDGHVESPTLRFSFADTSDASAHSLGHLWQLRWSIHTRERVPESIKQNCHSGELGAGAPAIARQRRHRRWPASSEPANEVLHRDVRLPQNGPRGAPVRFWRALSSAQDRATGWLVASALPARCQPVALVMLRRSYDGVTMGLRRGYEGNQGKSALRYGLATVSATAHCLIARHPLSPLSIRGRRQQKLGGS
jgi:hypothetical protein